MQLLAPTPDTTTRPCPFLSIVFHQTSPPTPYLCFNSGHAKFDDRTPRISQDHSRFHVSAPCASLILRPNLTASYLGKSRNLPRETPQSTFRHARSCCRPLLDEILLLVLACSSSNLTGSLSRRQLNVRVTLRRGRRTRPDRKSVV